MAVYEEGYDKIVIGIDKDKNSQSAFKWAIDNLVKGKDTPIILIHVKTNSYQTHDLIPKHGRAPNEVEKQQFFVLYRGFCARKGINVEEVILRDSDISKALIGYINDFNIGSVVVGASHRNYLLRKFKQADVPTSLGKSSPEFCGVYVISSKGKLQSVRPPNRPTSVPTICASPNNKGNMVLSHAASTLKPSLLQHPKFSNTHGGIPGGAGSDDISPRSTSNHHRFQMPSPSPSYQENYHNEYSDYASGETPRSQGQLTPNRFMPSPEIRRVRGKGSSAPRPILSSNLSISSNGSSQSSMDHPSFGSNGCQNSESSIRTELEAEMSKLKQEIHKTMELYHNIGNQANMTKQKIEGLLGQKDEDEYSMEDMKLAGETTMVLAELEGLKGKVALDIAKMTGRLRDMERKKKELDEERAKREAQREKKGNMNTLLTRSPTLQYRIYTLEEIEIATDYFSTSLKIGEGGYGPVYRGILHNTQVAIKVLRPDVSQGFRQFQQEIEVLGHIRHPHMVLLLGACPEYGCLVYEYMENGSLEDRLFRKNNTPPIPWQARFKIAYEIATALLFLHESKPEPMVHRDLKPANILLDGKYTSKISDVGLARLVPAKESNEKTQYHMTAAAGTFCYIDPEYQQTGLLGTKSDVYSLGVLLLQLLTAKPAMALAYHIEEAVEMGTFGGMLDPAVEDWPVEEAQSLAQLALQCCELRKKDRPDLGLVILPHLSTLLRDLALNS